MGAPRKAFKTETAPPGEPFVFTLDDEEFSCVHDLPRGVFADVVYGRIEAVALLRAVLRDPCPECGGDGRSGLTRRPCESCGGARTDDLARFDAIVRSKTRIITAESVTQIADWLLGECYLLGQRPLGSALPSGDGSSTTTTTSMEQP